MRLLESGEEVTIPACAPDSPHAKFAQRLRRGPMLRREPRVARGAGVDACVGQSRTTAGGGASKAYGLALRTRETAARHRAGARPVRAAPRTQSRGHRPRATRRTRAGDISRPVDKWASSRKCCGDGPAPGHCTGWARPRRQLDRALGSPWSPTSRKRIVPQGWNPEGNRRYARADFDEASDNQGSMSMSGSGRDLRNRVPRQSWRC